MRSKQSTRPFHSFLLFLLPCLLCFPWSVSAADAKPNFVIILADDMGFSDVGCYGGEIATPNLDKLAANGLRFTQFYNTARCWPTRSCIMSGYYAQQIRMDPPRGRLPAWAQLLPHRLKPLGYRSYHAGKWHVLGAPKPVADGGFDHSYWFQDWDRYFSPVQHWEDDVQAPPVKPDSGYYATTAFADRSIGFLKDHAANHAKQPFFLYLAFILPHFPLHALQEDIAKYRDRYLEGWDVVRERRWRRLREMGIVNCDLALRDEKLSPRYFKADLLEKIGPGESRYAVAWQSLTDEQRRFQATKMAIHAAMVDRMDREIGRVVEQLRAMGALENTVIFFLSDNGADATLMVRGDGHDRAAAPGSWQTFLCVGPGWASASNSPFRRQKVWVNEGGVSTPLIAHWPKGIAARGEFRRDVGHVIDFAPTLLDLAGGKAALPAGAPPLPGKSLVPAFARDGAVEREFLFFNHEGNRAMRMGDWKLVSAREDEDTWELFDLSTDRGERKNLIKEQPERARVMEAKWLALETEFRRQAGPAEPGKPGKPGKAKSKR
ncbi:MAG: arylsulfatase [Verrucomicrobia bacterium GWF2_62_7]|nr:MAG: arylsulfatase [Verrucomicrobia bacterium GWF2_62_7]